MPRRKDVGRERLVDAVRTVASGEELFAPQILERLVSHYVGQGLTNNEIAGSLFISLATVKTHILNVLAKLNLRDRPALPPTGSVRVDTPAPSPTRGLS